MDGLDDAAIRAVLQETKHIALAGASNKPDRPSFGVMRFLLEQGYAVTPVNPGLAGQRIHGQVVLATLDDVRDHQGKLDMVDVFRTSDQAGAVIDDAIRLGAHTVWLQLGVIDSVAAERGRKAGLVVVIDRCPVIEWSRLAIPARR